MEKLPEITQDVMDEIKIDQKIYTAEDVKLDPNALPDISDAPMSASSIPDLDVITGHVVDMLEFMDSSDMVKKRKENQKEFELVVYHKYRELMPTKIIDLLIEDRVGNLERLITMFDTLKDVKAGKKNMEKEYSRFTEDVNQQYVYSKYGGKDKFNKKMMEYAKTHKNKKN